MTTVVGLFKQYNNAEVALDRLLARGFTLDQITAIVPEAAVPKGGPVVPTAAANTQGIGNQPGVLGLGGAVAGLKGTVMPGIQDTGSAGGPRLDAMEPDTKKVGRGTDTDQLAASLVNRGLPEDLAQLYAEGVKHGYVLLAVDTEDQISDAKVIMNDANAADPIGLRKEFEFRDREANA